MIKRISFLFMLVILAFLLASCGPNKEASPFVDKGDEAMEKEDFAKAILAYSDAYNLDNNAKIYASLTEARTSRLEELKSSYTTAMSDYKYKKADEEVKIIKKDFKDLLTGDDKKDIEKDAKHIKSQLAKQKILDDYIVWSKPYVLRLQDISNKWMTVSRSISLNSSTQASLEKDISDLILKNQAILGDVETKTLNIDPSLNATHKELYKITLNNEAGFTSALGSLRDGESSDVISESGEAADEAKLYIASFIGKISTYAENNELRDTFKETLTKDQTSK